MNKELPPVGVLFHQNGALLVSHNGFINFFANVSLKPTQHAVHQQPAKLFQQHWRHLKGTNDLSSAFENADRLLEQKHTGSQFQYIAPLTSLTL
jgi:hypothetical protein